MIEKLEYNEICSWCNEELSDFDEVYSDIEGNSYCCENHLDSSVAVKNAVRSHSHHRYFDKRNK